MRAAIGPALLVLALAATAVSCSTGAEGVDVADGWSVEVVRDDLVAPTQIAAGRLGAHLTIAELNGGENAGTGRVLRLANPDGTGAMTIRATGLEVPTGVADSDGRPLLVQEQRRLVRLSPVASADGDDIVDTVVEVLDDGRPFNGRSQGTLTWLEDGSLLATATGSGSGPRVPERSGVLYALPRPLEVPDDARVIARGFKNAYGHAFDADGNLYVTEIGDGTYDGEPPRDELNLIRAEVWRAAVQGGEPYDGGWPRCTGAGDPTAEFGATAEECAAIPAPVATFPPRSTPTSVAVTTAGTVLVTLWVEGRVVEVDPVTGDVADVVTGLDGPQHLLARDDGSVLLTVHGSGQLLRLAPRP